MAREKAGYRETLSRIDGLFPNRISLTVEECAQAVGCSQVCRHTVRGVAVRIALVTKSDNSAYYTPNA